MGRAMRWVIRVAGFVLVVLSLYPFFRALQLLDRREYVAAALATVVGALTTRAGVEFLRPESAE